MPADPVDAMHHLGLCLTLVAPSGMNADDRAEWIKVAQYALREVPMDLLTRGCGEALKTCRFPSDIVPAILAEIELPLGWRIAERKRHEPSQKAIREYPRPVEPEYVDPKLMTELLRAIGQGPESIEAVVRKANK